MVQNIRSSAHTLHGAVCFLGDASGRRLAIVDGTTVKEFSPYARVLLPFQRGQRHTPMSGASRPSHFCNRNPGVESLRRFESRSATNQERDGHGENSASFVSKKRTVRIDLQRSFLSVCLAVSLSVTKKTVRILGIQRYGLPGKINGGAWSDGGRTTMTVTRACRPLACAAR